MTQAARFHWAPPGPINFNILQIKIIIMDPSKHPTARKWLQYKSRLDPFIKQGTHRRNTKCLVRGKKWPNDKFFPLKDYLSFFLLIPIRFCLKCLGVIVGRCAGRVKKKRSPGWSNLIQLQINHLTESAPNNPVPMGDLLYYCSGGMGPDLPVTNSLFPSRWCSGLVVRDIRVRSGWKGAIHSWNFV